MYLVESIFILNKKYKKFIDFYYSTHTAAAEDLGISRSHLSKIIHRKDNPSLTLLIKMENKMKEYDFEG